MTDMMMDLYSKTWIDAKVQPTDSITHCSMLQTQFTQVKEFIGYTEKFIN